MQVHAQAPNTREPMYTMIAKDHNGDGEPKKTCTAAMKRVMASTWEPLYNSIGMVRHLRGLATNAVRWIRFMTTTTTTNNPTAEDGHQPRRQKARETDEEDENTGQRTQIVVMPSNREDSKWKEE